MQIKLIALLSKPELKTSLSALSQHNLKRKDGTMNKQISAWPLSANAASCIQNPKPLLVNQESIKTATKIEQFSDADRVAALTHQYLELGLPLDAAHRAAEADLWSARLFSEVLAPAVGHSSMYKICPLYDRISRRVGSDGGLHREDRQTLF
jgi:hypothetical protein